MKRYALVPMLGTLALLVIAGCSSSPTPGTLPLGPPNAVPTVSPTTAATATPVATATPTPFSSFGGSSTSAAFTPSGGMLNLAPYLGYTFDSNWGSNNGPANFTMNLADATGAGDLGGAVPAYNAGGTVVLYLDIMSSVAVTFAQTPAIALTSMAGFPAGSTCGVAAYLTVWRQTGITVARPSGTTLTIPAGTLASGGTVDIPSASHRYIAIYCQ